MPNDPILEVLVEAVRLRDGSLSIKNFDYLRSELAPTLAQALENCGYQIVKTSALALTNQPHPKGE